MRSRSEVETRRLSKEAFKPLFFFFCFLYLFPFSPRSSRRLSGPRELLPLVPAMVPRPRAAEEADQGPPLSKEREREEERKKNRRVMRINRWRAEK